MNGWAVCCARLMQADGKTILNTDKKVIPIGGNETTHMGLSNPHFLWNIVCRLLGTIVCKYKHILLNKSSQVSPNARRRAQCKGGGGKEKNKNNILIRFAAEIIYAVVSPAMFFGLATLPLTKNCLQKPGVVQRQMLRSI